MTNEHNSESLRHRLRDDRWPFPVLRFLTDRHGRRGTLARTQGARTRFAERSVRFDLGEYRAADDRCSGARIGPDCSGGGGRTKGADERADARAALPVALSDRGRRVAGDRVSGGRVPTHAQRPLLVAASSSNRGGGGSVAGRMGILRETEQERRGSRA